MTRGIPRTAVRGIWQCCTNAVMVLLVLAALHAVDGATGRTQELPAGGQTQQVQRAIRMVESGLTSSQQKLAALRSRLPSVLEEADELMRRVESVQTEPAAPPEVAPEDKRKESKRVPFRPPLIRATEKEGNVAIVCEDDRLTIVDVEAVSELGSALDSELIRRAHSAIWQRRQ